MNFIFKIKSDDFGDFVRLLLKCLFEIVFFLLNNGRISYFLWMGGWLVYNGELKMFCVGEKVLVCFMYG